MGVGHGAGDMCGSARSRVRYTFAMDGNGNTATIREELHHIADKLPDGATWHDVMEEVYLQIVIEDGLKASREGRVKPLEEVMRKYGLPE